MVLRMSGGRRLRSPRGDVTRPTTGRVRLAVMNMLATELRGCRWLELCGGSAVMSCEALQRGASAVVVVERDHLVAAVARNNLAAVAAGLALDGGPKPSAVVVQQEALRFLELGAAANGLEPFDLIYADPPWDSGLYPRLAEAVASAGWLVSGGTMVWECAQDSAIKVPMGWQERRRKAYGASELVLLKLTEA